MKPLTTAKSRLASILSVEKRQQLVIALYKNTLSVISKWTKIGGILVVSPDSSIQELTPDVPISFLHEDRECGLNFSIKMAASKLSVENIDSMLVIHADLPLINLEALTKLIEKSVKPGLCIATDYSKAGTNVMLLSPPDSIPFAYGENSCQKHMENARKIGLPVNCIFSDTLSMDIDLPEDLTRLFQADCRVEESFFPIIRELEGIIK